MLVVVLGVLIDAKGAVEILLPVALVTVPLAAVLYGIVRVTRTRQRWAFLLAVGADVVLALVFGYLIVTMQRGSRTLTACSSASWCSRLRSGSRSRRRGTSPGARPGSTGSASARSRPRRRAPAPIDAPLIGGPTAYVSAGPALANMGTRTFAYLVDLILSGVLSAVPVAIAVAISGGLRVSPILILGVALGTVINLGYFAFFWHRGGQTPGMLLTHLKVVHEAGDPALTWGNAFRRYVVFVFGAVVLYLGFLWAFVDPRRKAWHDTAARTIVIDVVAEAANRKTDAVYAETVAKKAAAAATTEAERQAALERALDDDPSDDAAEPIIAGIVAVEAARPVSIIKGQPLLTVQGLKKHFPIYGGILRKRIGTVYAVDGVDFEIMPGETFALVGESGCGKTTLGRTIIQLTPSTEGRVVFDGYELADVDPDDMRPLRRRMQIIFQDPFGSLNPRMPVSDLIGEGLLAQGLTDRATRDKRVEDSLELVGLRREYTRRYPHEFSGGQRQRIGVARALALGPDFIVADEPVSALDVSIQSQVLNLLLDLKRELNLTYLFISHNLSVVQYFSDRVGVMYLGKIAEIGTVDQLYRDPRHPYTVSLLSAIPEANPRRRKSRIVLKGDVPSPAAPPSGCRFHTRCWLRERLGNPENCSTIEPQLRTFGQEGHQVACHWAEEVSPTTVSQAAAETPAIVAAATDDE